MAPDIISAGSGKFPISKIRGRGRRDAVALTTVGGVLTGGKQFTSVNKYCYIKTQSRIQRPYANYYTTSKTKIMTQFLCTTILLSCLNLVRKGQTAGCCIV